MSGPSAQLRSTLPASIEGPAHEASLWKIVAIAMLGSLLAQLDATIVNVSISPIASHFHAPLSSIQWVTSGYLLALAFALPLNAWLIERFGAKVLYLWCFSIFALCSALCGLAWSAPSLIGFRLLQGACGGVLAPMAQLMVKRAAGDQFTRIAGYASIPVLLGPALGPVIAGAVLHLASWRWLFLVNVPVCILAVALARVFLPNDTVGSSQSRFDWLGLTFLSPGLVLLLLGLDHVSRPMGFASVMAGLLLLAAFLWIERRKGEAGLVDLALFRNRVFALASAVQFLWNGVMFAGQMLVPMFLIDVWREQPTAMGWMMAPLGLGMMITVPLLGLLTRRLGERTVPIMGAFLSLASTLVLAWLATRDSDRVILAAALLARGAGLGAVAIPVVSMAYAGIEQRALPMAAASINIVQRLGGPVLTTFCALLLSWLVQMPQLEGAGAWAYALLALAALHGIMTTVTMALPRTRRG